MAKKNASPITTWIIWGILVLGVFLLVTWEYFIAGFSADASRITWLIVGFFVYGFIASLRIAYYLQSEFISLQAMDENQRIGDANASDVAAMFDAALVRINRGDRLDIRNLVSAYGAKLRARTENISVVSNMLVTIGLLGTVIGLIITITGLSTVLSATGADYSTMKTGLNQTVSGMGTAFYTTFFGALLGGVVLKVLGAEMKKSATQLVADTLRFAELFVGPKVEEASSEALNNLETRVQALDRQIERLGGSFAAVIDTLDSKQQTLASGLGDLVVTVEQTGSEAHALATAVATTVEETNRMANERLETTLAVSKEAERMANERLEATVATSKESDRLANERLEAVITAAREATEQTNRLSDERLGAMMDRVGLMIDETHNKADERLGALSNTIGQTTDEMHRLANERLQALLKAVESATQDTHRQADERLIELVDTVGVSIEHSRKQAEARLGAKASDLASKLIDAAAAVAALNDVSGTPGNEEPGGGE